jgi:hypothetical protein
MSRASESVQEALAIEEESAREVEAARAEQQRGEPALSAGLLLESIRKERESLDLFDQGINTLKQALEQRKRSLEQQQEILQDLVESISDRD